MKLKIKKAPDVNAPRTPGKSVAEDGTAEGEDAFTALATADAISEKRIYVDPREEFALLRSKLLIDRDALDDAMIEQPVLFQEVSEAQVLAQSEAAAAKEKLAGTDATLAHEIRVMWTNAGEKFSEVKVGDAVQGEPRHIAAYDRWSALARRAAYLGALKESYDQRMRMLRELGQLFVVGYFSRTTSGAAKRDVDAGTAAAGREGMRKARANAGY